MDGGSAFPVKDLTKAERADLIVLAVNQMGHLLLSEGLSRRDLIGAFGCGLSATVLQEFGLDHQDEKNSQALLGALDTCIEETIAQLRTRQPESGNG